MIDSDQEAKKEYLDQSHNSKCSGGELMICLLKLTLAFMLCTVAYGATMRNSDVVRMVRQGASVTEIVNRVNASESGFTLYEEDVRALRESGVPEIVIRAMFVRQSGEKLQLGSSVPTTQSQAAAASGNVNAPQFPNAGTPQQNAPVQPPQGIPARQPDLNDYSRVEVFGGYSIVRPNLPGGLVPGSASDSAMVERVGEFALGNVLGWGSSVTVNLNRSVGITGDFNGSYRSIDVTVNGSRLDANGSLHTILFGPTFTMRKDRVRPFVHALFGVGRVAASAKIDGDSIDFAKNGFAAAAGGGLDLVMGSRISFRAIEVDYLPYRQGNGEVFTFNNIRWRSGLVFHF